MYVFAFTNLIMKTIIQDLLVKNKEKAEIFITIITIITIIILVTIAFVLWAIIYGGSQSISDTEQRFDDDKEAGLHTHSLRHTCATILYRSGIDIKVIQKLHINFYGKIKNIRILILLNLLNIIIYNLIY